MLRFKSFKKIICCCESPSVKLRLVMHKLWTDSICIVTTQSLQYTLQGGPGPGKSLQFSDRITLMYCYCKYRKEITRIDILSCDCISPVIPSLLCQPSPPYTARNWTPPSDLISYQRWPWHSPPVSHHHLPLLLSLSGLEQVVKIRLPELSLIWYKLF